MLSWAWRCFALAIAGACAFASVQDGGLWDVAFRQRGAAEARKADAAEPQQGGGALEEVIVGAPDGHFTTDVHVNGIPITFLIDTGASHIILNAHDAERLGIARSRLRYDVEFQSANGITRAAPVTLRDVRLGQFQLHDLDAYVNQGNLSISLLGMSFLRQLESYEVVRNRLILRR